MHKISQEVNRPTSSGIKNKVITDFYFKNDNRIAFTRLLKFSDICDNLYSLGNRSRVLALQCWSNKPMANGVAAVNILYKHTINML